MISHPVFPRGRDVHRAIAEAVTRLLHAVDARDWNAVRAVLGDPVRTDYTSLFGGEPETQSGDELVAAWRALLPGFDATQHLTGPLVTNVKGGRATARCAVTATHALGESRWVVGGHYAMELARKRTGWVVTAIRLETAFVDGDRDLPEKARERLASRS